MNDTVRRIRNFFVSLKLTVVLLAFGIVLIFAATLAQVDLGIWAVQKEFFRSFIAIWHVGALYVPLPGGYLVGGLLLVNLIAAHVYRFKLSWGKAGILLTHLGLILLLVGELLTGLWQEEFQMRLEEGAPKNYSESPRYNELAIVETTDSKFDNVVAIPTEVLERGETIQHPNLPFRVVPKFFFPNALAQDRAELPNPPPPVATAGVLAERYVVAPQPPTAKQNEQNIPAAVVELVGSDAPVGSWLVTPEVPVRLPLPNGSSQLALRLTTPQRFTYVGRSWEISLRPSRDYRPFSLTLLKFSHDIYPGTDIPKNFSSRVRLTTSEGHDDREVTIYMNNPLRYAGLTFYQASFEEGNDKVTILQVVRNPSWLLPYISCALVFFGLVVQFLIHLISFIGKRNAAKAATA